MCIVTHGEQNYILCGKVHTVSQITHSESNYTMFVKLHTLSKMKHCLWNNKLCTKVHCQESFSRYLWEKIPLSQYFYTSTDIDAMDKYQVWLCKITWQANLKSIETNDVVALHNMLKLVRLIWKCVLKVAIEYFWKFLICDCNH